MNAENTEKRQEDPQDDEPAKWPAVVGVILIILFTVAGIEVFVLPGQPIATLDHTAISSEEGGGFTVENSEQEYMVQVWSYTRGEEDESLEKADATLAFTVVDPSGEVVVEHEDAEARADARYVKIVPKTAGEYRVRLVRIDDAKAQAVVLTGNDQVLLPLIGKVVD